MRNEIYEALIKCDLPCFYVSKKSVKSDEYIIFSFSNTLYKISDTEEDLLKYTVYISIYTKDDDDELKNNIIKNMNKIGFYRKNMPKAYYEESLNLFNQVIQFQGIKERSI